MTEAESQANDKMTHDSRIVSSRFGVTSLMNFASICERFEWVRYSGQMDSDVTYVFVLNEPIGRLAGESDILYIGKTEQAIKVRFEQETRTNNSPKNTQQTNIRMSFVFGKIGLENVNCFFLKALTVTLTGTEKNAFLDGLRTWDKKSFLALAERQRSPEIEVSVEKYLLVRYATDHLEVPPMNNRM